MEGIEYFVDSVVLSAAERGGVLPMLDASWAGCWDLDRNDGLPCSIAKKQLRTDCVSDALL
jgi:hypothetical protein